MKGDQGFAAAIGWLRGDERGGFFDPGGDTRATLQGPWELEARVGSDGTLQRTPIETLPFRIGRAPGLELVLPWPQISKNHAEIYTAAGRLRVRDLSSRNGTFLNGQFVVDTELQDGDILHFGDVEFRLVQAGDEPSQRHDETCSLNGHWRPREIRELLRERSVTTCLQPIVHLPSGRVAAYEALGRGRHPGLPEGAERLFETAGQVGPEAQTELSQLFRRTAVEQARGRVDPPVLF